MDKQKPYQLDSYISKYGLQKPQPTESGTSSEIKYKSTFEYKEQTKSSYQNGISTDSFNLNNDNVRKTSGHFLDTKLRSPFSKLDTSTKYHTIESTTKPPSQYWKPTMKNNSDSKSSFSIVSQNDKYKSTGVTGKGLFYTFDEAQKTPYQIVNIPNRKIEPITTVTTTVTAKPTNQFVIKPQVESEIKTNKISLFSTKQKQNGFALIFNHEFYNNKMLKQRKGTHNDVSSLEIVFKDYNIKTEVKNDLTLKQINKEIQRLQNFDFKPYKCFLVVILTYGDRDEILYAKDVKYNLDETIIKPTIQGNKTLTNKPKIFIIQACKGNEVLLSTTQTDSLKANQVTGILKCYSTFEYNVSYRNTNDGTTFIQTLCRLLKEKGKYLNIYDLMTECNKQLTALHDTSEVPSIYSTLSAPFCFGHLVS